MNIRVIPKDVHGAVDYLTAPALVAAPELLRLDGARGSAVAPRVAGLTTALYAALTDYDVALRRVIPMRLHLLLDAAVGGALAAAPWVSGSARRGSRHWLPHAIVGASELALALTTRPDPPANRLRRAAAPLRHVGRAAAALPPSRRAPLIGVAVVLAAATAYAGRRQLFRVAAVAAELVEEAADAVEDAADYVEDVAEDLADAAKARAAADKQAE